MEDEQNFIFNRSTLKEFKLMLEILKKLKTTAMGIEFQYQNNTDINNQYLYKN
jgi:hypothetical protein